MTWSWDLMLHAFRGLGGKIDNVARKPGAAGRGLAPIDPERPVRIQVPANLILSPSDIEFTGDSIRIKDGTAVGSGERAFLEHYLNDIAWDGGGKAEATAFIEGLDELPSEVKDLLSSEFAMKPYFEGDNRIHRWFLESRRLGWRAQPAIAPILDLIEHDSSANPAADQDGLAFSGRFAGDIRMLRSEADPILFFRRFGYASPERIAFSQPLSLTPQGCSIHIKKTVNMSATIGSAPVPAFEFQNGALDISCIMLGNAAYPRVPRGIFRAMTRGLPVADPDHVFDAIQHQNRMIFLGLLQSLEAHQGRMIGEIRTVAIYQLQAMSFCIGAREP
ncbi:MAG TPA: hypothetical protein VGK90_01860 [Rhizomicrobium sp.]|jgi:hypothetical protein